MTLEAGDYAPAREGCRDHTHAGTALFMGGTSDSMVIPPLLPGQKLR